MARFYGSMQGDRGAVTRMGHRGITAHPRGWNLGIQVTAEADENDRDTFYVYVTGGSNGHGSSRLLAIVRDGNEIVPEIAWREELRSRLARLETLPRASGARRHANRRDRTERN